MSRKAHEFLLRALIRPGALLSAVVLPGGLATGIGTIEEAKACSGFLACTFVAPVLGDDAAVAADAWNAQNGKIVDHGVAALLDVVVPGTGEVLEGYWTAQDIRNAFQDGELSEDDAVQLLAQLAEDQ